MLSSIVGIIGTVILLGINPDMLPSMTPSITPLAASSALNDSDPAVNASVVSGHRVRLVTTGRGDNLILAGLATRETVEMAVWMASVLFCSCVCFGNVGRRLAVKSQSAKLANRL